MNLVEIMEIIESVDFKGDIAVEERFEEDENTSHFFNSTTEYNKAVAEGRVKPGDKVYMGGLIND